MQPPKRSVVRSALVFGVISAAGAVLLTAWPAESQQTSDLTPKIRETAAKLEQHLRLLKSPDQATRIAAFTEMVQSGNPSLVDLAIEAALNSDDKAMQALGLRAGFRQVRSIVAKLEPAPQASAQSEAVIKACGDATQYKVENYSFETGTFEVHGQDHTGVGQVNGGTVSLTIQYGCSLTGALQTDGSLAGLVSAPYKKGSLAAKINFR